MSKTLDKEINLKDLYHLLRKKIWIIIACTTCFAALGAYYVSIPRPPLYEASTRVFLQANKDLFETLKVIFREPVVLEGVVQQLQLQRSAEALRANVTVSSVNSSTVLRIGVTDSSPELAAEIANAIVASYEQIARNTVFATNLIVLTEADASQASNPINVKSNRALYASVIAGLFIGIALIFIMDSLNDTVRTDRDIEQWLGVAVLGNVSKVHRKDQATLSNQKKRKKKETEKVLLRGEAIGP